MLCRRPGGYSSGWKRPKLHGPTNKEYTKMGFEINIIKTEYIAIWEEGQTCLKVDKNITIRGVDKFRYLGFALSERGTAEEEIKIH